MFRDPVKRTFDEEPVLRKFHYEKQIFLDTAFPKRQQLKRSDHCAWREAAMRFSNIHQQPMSLRRVHQLSELKTLQAGLSSDATHTSNSILSKLCGTLKEKTNMLSADWRMKRSQLNNIFDLYKRLDGIPPLDEFKWMKNDVLYGNYDVIHQDVDSKMSDVMECIRLMNEMYSILKSLLGEFVIDNTKKTESVLQSFQVWEKQDFELALAQLDHYLEELRKDGLQAADMQRSLEKEKSYVKVKTEAAQMVEKYSEGGYHTKMDQERLRWAKNLSYSLQIWSDIMSQRLYRCTVLFDDVMELVFLADRVFPFLLDKVKKLSEDNKMNRRKTEELLEDWKEISMFAVGLELKLNVLDSKLQHKWVEGYKEVKRLLEDLLRLKRLIGFLWGEASCLRIYSQIDFQVKDLMGAVEKMSRYNYPPGVRFERRDLLQLSEQVFNLVSDFGLQENHFNKFKNLDSAKLKRSVTELRESYESLCAKLASQEVAEKKDRIKEALNRQEIPSVDIGSKLSHQATHPEKNAAFVREDLKNLMDQERSNSTPDQLRLASLNSLKTILSTGSLFDKLVTYGKTLETTFQNANKSNGFIVKRLSVGLDPALKKEEEMLAISQELQAHIEVLSKLLEGRKLDNVVLGICNTRLELERMAAEVIEGLTGSIRSYTTAAHNFDMVSRLHLDLLDPDQVSLIAHTYNDAFTQLDRLKSICNEGAKRYYTSTVLSKALNLMYDFCSNFFSVLGINAPDLIIECQHLREFSNSFHPMEALFDRIEVEIRAQATETTLIRLIHEYMDHYNKCQVEHSKISGMLHHIPKLFVTTNKEEMEDGFEYVTMVKEMLGSFVKILEQRIANGFADPASYRDLDQVMLDKPETLLQLSRTFRSHYE